MSFVVETVSPSKTILTGEHSVVYGHDAITLAVGRYTTVIGKYEKQYKSTGLKIIQEGQPDEASLYLEPALLGVMIHKLLANEYTPQEMRTFVEYRF